MLPASSTNELVRHAAVQLRDELNRLEPLADNADDEVVYPQIAQACERCLDQLRQTNLVGLDNETASSVLWNVAGDVLARGWLQHRARMKPRGYAGDYELLARFYQRRLCDDPLGRLFDRYFQEQPAPRAVENRMRMMADWIVATARDGRSGPLNVAMVGSAFGLELRDLLLRLDPHERERIHLTLLDLDPFALDFARELLAPLVPPQNLILEDSNPLRLLKKPQLAARLEGSDLIFCPGVFDYLNDAEAAEMLRLLYGRLAPGGRVTVFQFAPHDPTRAYMEWIGQWHLTYRDAAELRTFVEQAQLATADITYGAEPLGVDLFVTARRVPR
jgi:extracellular factor (EF) 3-hydroxypalmitic acid methyl ester biosynthesis protein